MNTNERKFSELKEKWVRTSMIMPEVVRMLEDELARMKAKGLSEAVLASKNFQIESLIKFYNASEELVSDAGAWIRHDGVLKKAYAMLLEKMTDEMQPDRFFKLMEKFEDEIGFEGPKYASVFNDPDKNESKEVDPEKDLT